MSLGGRQPLNVLIVGGGVAGLEAALALRDLAGGRVTTTMLTPEPEFVYRPLRVREPFAGPAARHYTLAEIARDIGIQLEQDALEWLEPTHRTVHTHAGRKLTYDALLLAPGGRQRPRFKHALTIDDRHLDEQLHGLIQDIEGGYIDKIAFIASHDPGWPLPLYELALMTARRADDMGVHASVTLVTPEDEPLALFGGAVSEAVDRLLHDSGIMVISATHAETPETGRVALYPGGQILYVDRIVALPELFGPATPGVPMCDDHGFISVDAYCRVLGLDDVFAAGDATAFAVKHGGIAAQQADIAAQGIAALAGAPIKPGKLHPEIHGILLGGTRPLYLSAHISGTRGSGSTVSDRPDWSPPTKIAAKYLAPYLEAYDRTTAR